MAPLPEQLDLIVASMLAANSFSLSKAQEIIPALRHAHLLDPNYVCELEPGPLTVELANAGYNRGMLTSMFAERLRALIKAVRDGHFDALDAAVKTGDETQVLKMLTGVKGVGPVVARTAWTLLMATEKNVATSSVPEK